ncbi:hypothetical protein GCM10027440_56360 [Nocardiopsis coralliicola]
MPVSDTRGSAPRSSAAPAAAQQPGGPHLLDRIGAVPLALGGSTSTAASGALMKASGAEPATAAFLRCALALPVLLPMALLELRRAGRRPARHMLTDSAAGVLLGIDFVLWATAIQAVGAGVATVLINIQVVVFPLLTALVTGVRPARSFIAAVPVLLAGLALAAGLGPGAGSGDDPLLGLATGCGAGAAYAGYLFLTRLGGGRGHAATPVLVSTATAAASAAALGGLLGGLEFASLTAASWAWLCLLALTGQVLTWLLIGAALPRLDPGSAAAILVLPPVFAIVIGMVFLGEQPTLLQGAGCALVVLTVWAAERTARRGAPQPEGDAQHGERGRPVDPQGGRCGPPAGEHDDRVPSGNGGEDGNQDRQPARAEGPAQEQAEAGEGNRSADQVPDPLGVQVGGGIGGAEAGNRSLGRNEEADTDHGDGHPHRRGEAGKDSYSGHGSTSEERKSSSARTMPGR